jgi:hypothetical protein
MFYILILVASFALVGAFIVGFKLARFSHERRKNRALRYLKETGFYPPVYTGCHEPTPIPHQKVNAANAVDQLLYIGIVVAVLYASWCGLT